MNQENQPQLENTTNTNTKVNNNKPSATAAAEGLSLKEYKDLIPKTVSELAAIQARGRKLFVKKKYHRKNPNNLQKPREKTKEELGAEAVQRQKDIQEYKGKIGYSNYYFDDRHEYRHVILPKVLAQWLPHNNLLKESEWIALGVSQSSGWEHYMIYAPEPHILLFRREINYLAKHGLDKQRPAEVQVEESEQVIVEQEIKVEQEITNDIVELPESSDQ